MTAVWLVLASALLHAGWNLCLKWHRDPEAATAAVVAGTAGLTLAAGVAEAAWLGKPAFATWSAAALACCCGLTETVMFVSLGRALHQAPLGLAYTVIRGGSILLVWPLAFLAQGEVPDLSEVTGAVTVVLGLAVLYPRGPGQSTRSGYLWASLGACGVAANMVLYKAALSAGALPWCLFAAAMGVAAPATLGAGRGRDLWRRTGAAVRTQPLVVGTSAIQATVGFGLALMAMQTTGAAWVGTLRNTSVAAAPILGWVFLGERPTARSTTGFGLVLAGVVLLVV
ncbi:MAG: EamA family transporter [Candidatus Riflebacteria bacterium]|nr:EamA family transporter [Candidatus Riflebacteria bacterium]